jgi:hypothetical protein
MPQETKYKIWIHENMFFEAGYKQEDLDKMDEDEFQFKLALVIDSHMKKSVKAAMPFGGI